MKPFNLEAALRGEKVVTRDGREVTQLTHFKVLGKYPLYAVIENDNFLVTSTISGQWSHGSREENPNDLFMATKMKKVECRLYKSLYGDIYVAINNKEYLSKPSIRWVSDILEVEIEDND